VLLFTSVKVGSKLTYLVVELIDPDRFLLFFRNIFEGKLTFSVLKLAHLFLKVSYPSLLLLKSVLLLRELRIQLRYLFKKRLNFICMLFTGQLKLLICHLLKFLHNTHLLFDKLFSFF
jgi:hypothetical protein